MVNVTSTFLLSWSSHCVGIGPISGPLNWSIPGKQCEVLIRPVGRCALELFSWTSYLDHGYLLKEGSRTCKQGQKLSSKEFEQWHCLFGCGNFSLFWKLSIMQSPSLTSTVSSWTTSQRNEFHSVPLMSKALHLPVVSQAWRGES